MGKQGDSQQADEPGSVAAQVSQSDGQQGSNGDNPEQAQAATFLITEHTTLQTASSATVFESNGRAGLLLTSVSSAVVALAFIGQISQMGAAFYIFALVLFPSLFFVGLFTFVQVLDTAIQNVGYRRGMNRIRHFYVQIAPSAESYFIRATSNDAAASESIIDPVVAPSAWGIFLTTAGMVSVVNSVLLGVFVGVLVQVVFGLSLIVCTGVGIVFFLLSVVIHYAYQLRAWVKAERHFKSTFPPSA
ncbi:MAG: hypothetical protein DLM69_03015 [Candidatus Chloroheliales bacterium]|nr:MAG: hypothetical protein DLM69_03015 [Chloroflexota bacterium]